MIEIQHNIKLKISLGHMSKESSVEQMSVGVVGVVAFYNLWTTNKLAYMLIRIDTYIICPVVVLLSLIEMNAIGKQC